ncbi:hypothetical protein JCM11251_002461 [Rhodosporidiobolus azoricus]
MAAEAAQSAAMQEVIPQLWIGDYQAAQDLNMLEEKGVSCVVSAMRQEYDAHAGIELHRVAVDDDDRTNIAEHFERTAEFIHAAMERDQGVLVHCQAGVSRSTTLVAAYLMIKHGLNVEQAVEKIRCARAQVEPSDFFMMQLELFERCDCEWDPVKWPEERRFLMSFAQTQIMEGASPSIVLAYYPSPASTPQNAPGSAALSMTSMPSERISPPPSPARTAPSASGLSATVNNLPSIHPNPIPSLSAPPARKRLTPRKITSERLAEEEQQKKAEIEKIGSKEKVVVSGRRIRCKMCRRELAAREHIVAHEIGKGQQAFAPNRRDMVAFRAEQEKRRAEELQKAASPAIAQTQAPRPVPAAASPQPPTNPLAGLRISQPLPGLRVSMPRGAPVARPQPVARPTRSEAAPTLTTRDEELAASSTFISSDIPAFGAAHATPPVSVVSQPDAPADLPSSAPAPPSASSTGPESAPSSPSPPPTSIVDPPLLPSPACSSYFVEPLSWMSPILETGVLAGKIVCPNKKCGAKLGNFDWAGNQCSCGAWVCPGFALNVSKVDEITA